MGDAWVRIRFDGRSEDLFPGSVVGRSSRVDLVINHPDVSEAHALLCLEDNMLKLRQLGGQLWLHGVPARMITLRPGQRITIAASQTLVVEDVVCPAEELGLSVNGAPAVRLEGHRAWITREGFYGAPVPRAVRVWRMGEDWFCGSPAKLLGDESVCEAGLELRLVPMSAAITSPWMTTSEPLGLYPPVQIVTSRTHVEVHQPGKATLALSGDVARLVRGLAGRRGPVSWDTVAASLWPELSVLMRRRQWDQALASLRAILRSAGIRPDLVKTSAGRVSLSVPQVQRNRVPA